MKKGAVMSDSMSTIKPVHPSLLEKSRALRGKQVTQNTNQEYDETITLGDRLSDKLSEIAGSWAFIFTFAGIIICRTSIHRWVKKAL